MKLSFCTAGEKFGCRVKTWVYTGQDRGDEYLMNMFEEFCHFMQELST
jgi:hypothetical protein